MTAGPGESAVWVGVEERRPGAGGDGGFRVGGFQVPSEGRVWFGAVAGEGGGHGHPSAARRVGADVPAGPVQDDLDSAGRSDVVHPGGEYSASARGLLDAA